MKSKLILTYFFLFWSSIALANNINIEAKNITIDKNKQTSIFENEVVIQTIEKNKIQSDYAEYDKSKGIIKLKNNVILKDKRKNIVETNLAEYNEESKIFTSIGKTKVVTTDEYIIESENIVFDNQKKLIFSTNKTIIIDRDNNKIFLENFEYLIKQNIFKSIGLVKIKDTRENSYEFSQIYIDTKKKEILGTDIKAFLNNETFKVNEKNKPRIFSNTVSISKQSSQFNKSKFTLCDYRDNDKCPPWTIQSSKMLHDNKKKTIYYDNAVVKIYDIPVFYLPKLSHPDPTVDRRSGFLPPSFSDTKNLGFGISIPYFFAIDRDKNFTLTSKIYKSENPLFLGEYHQAFENSNFLADFGYTEGYKKTSITKKSGEKSHFFAKFDKSFVNQNNSESSFSLSFQDISNDKYLKLYRIKSNLVDYNTDTLESSFDFTHENENLFFGVNASIYETLKENYNDKYEYIFPEIALDKNLFSNSSLGNLDLQTNLKVHNYDTNKLTNFLVNDLNWNFREINFDSGLKGNVLGNIKNINYEAKNVELYKTDPTSELFASLGFLTEIDFKKDTESSKHFLTPKLLVRYAPGSMRKETAGSRLTPAKAFNLNRLDNINNYETGLSGTIGLDYKIKNNYEKEFDFSLAQVINEIENKKMPTKAGLDEKLSDLVGSATFKANDRISLNYNFAVDQNYSDLNYNEIGTAINYNPVKIDFSYLEENKHIGNQEYFKTKVAFENNSKLLSFETKRNLVTDSSEFYNLSYEYINDCLRAGLVYRREFYTDSELEAENSLMFKITIVPFGNINSPSFNK